MSGAMFEAFEYTVGEQRHIGSLVSHPAATPKAAVVLLPDWRGQTGLARDHAQHLAGLGCTVVIADMYGEGFSPDSLAQVKPIVARLVADRRRNVDALSACLRRLRESVPAGTPVVCVGYSAGGMIALDLGRSGEDVAGIVLCSALLKTAEDGMGTRIRAPVLVLQGTQDEVSPLETVNAVIAEMDAAGNDVRVCLYGQTHHAFDNPEAGTDPGARLVYSPVSAARARRAIAGFIAEVGRQPGGSTCDGL